MPQLGDRNNSTLVDPKTSLKPTLRFVDAVAIIVGIVIGAGIFETPALVAGNTRSATSVILVWLAGGVISLIGALCYAELAITYPHPGGNYYYLKKAFGKNVSFLFSWARMTIIQPGSIVLLAFVLGDYASQILPLGNYSSSLYAVGAIALFSGLNLLGIRQSKWTQNWLALVEVLGLVLVVVIGFLLVSASPAPIATPTEPTSSANFGLAMVFVLLSYGGWNEAAYISAELHDLKRNMLRSLLWSIGIISTIYLLVNLAYLKGLGLSGMAQSEAIAATLMRRAFGEGGAQFISLLVVVAALSSLNATILTGARTNYALGRDFSFFSWLGHWHPRMRVPSQALLVQSGISLALVVFASLGRKGFTTMVDFTSPIYWFFFLLAGLSLLILRKREPEIPRPFRVPFYPAIPLLFCLACAYMLYASLAYTGIGSLVGVAVLLAGVPFLFFKGTRH